MDINSGDDLLDVAYVHKQTSEAKSKYLIFYPSLTWAQSFYSEPSIFFLPLLNSILQIFPHSKRGSKDRGCRLLCLNN